MKGKRKMFASAAASPFGASNQFQSTNDNPRLRGGRRRYSKSTMATVQEMQEAMHGHQTPKLSPSARFKRGGY